jgi:hypothetical protein
MDTRGHARRRPGTDHRGWSACAVRPRSAAGSGGLGVCPGHGCRSRASAGGSQRVASEPWPDRLCAHRAVGHRTGVTARAPAPALGICGACRQPRGRGRPLAATSAGSDAGRIPAVPGGRAGGRLARSGTTCGARAFLAGAPGIAHGDPARWPCRSPASCGRSPAATSGPAGTSGGCSTGCAPTRSSPSPPHWPSQGRTWARPGYCGFWSAGPRPGRWPRQRTARPAQGLHRHQLRTPFWTSRTSGSAAPSWSSPTT